MADRKNVHLQASTTKEIAGATIKTIPTGTRFIITWLSEECGGSSVCEGLEINLIHNDEFKLNN